MTCPIGETVQLDDAVSVAKKYYQTYVDKDRSLIEELIAEDFHFSSPLDNRIDRQTYFARCWPNSENITAFRLVRITQSGRHVFVTYEGHNRSSQVFRNTEVLTVQDGQLVEIEVYFGWSVPHCAVRGGFVDQILHNPEMNAGAPKR
jgi:hypothetical protein